MPWRSACAVLIFVAVTLIESCALRRPYQDLQTPTTLPAPKADARASPPVPSVSFPATVSFESSIRPVLATRCAPCHEPGGKMYERLPFDDSKTVSSHADGIRGRLKGEDREALERWLESLPASPGVE